MPADNRLMIVPCENPNALCQSFICNDMSPTVKKYTIGNPHSGALAVYPVFCADCISHMIFTLPAELSPAAAEIKAKIKAELTDEYNELLAEKVAAIEKRAVAAAEQMAAMKLADAQSVFGEVSEEVAEEVTENKDKTIYRCLDCGADFDEKQALDAHKVTHEQPAKNKGGRPAKKTQP